MSTGLEYALGVATEDVAETIRWLLRDGFELVEERGGRAESFGNVLLRMQRGSSAIRVVRDRSQWLCDVESSGWTGEQALGVLVTAMRGQPPTHEYPMPDEGMPEQLPPGGVWSQLVPEVLAWGASGNRDVEVTQAAAEWREAIRRRLG